MFELLIIWEWVGFVVCWVYVIIVIVWIGFLFYFIVLDLGLCRGGDFGGVDGEEWQVYGGGFYYVCKYFVVFSEMFDYLMWFKWESYLIWFLGFVLFMVIYWVGGEFYLVDSYKSDIFQF